MSNKNYNKMSRRETPKNADEIKNEAVVEQELNTIREPERDIYIGVDLSNSTDDFYLVRTSSGAFEGYCMKQYIDVE